jgi:uncharacterized protein (DUF58 family)
MSSVLAFIQKRHAGSRKKPRRRAKLTREGKAFVFVTVGVGFGAVNTGNNLLYLMLALMLSLLLLSMVLSEIALLGVTIRRRLPTRVFAKTPSLVELVLSNKKRFLPSYSLEVEDRSEADPTDRRCYFLKTAPSSEQTAAYRRVAKRRGWLKLDGYRVGTRYPFGLVEKAYLHTDEEELLVFPELVDVDASVLRGLLDGADHEVAHLGRGTEVAGLREYRSGDEARAIHWRRSAALGALVVRERHQDASARVTLALDNARPEPREGATDAAGRAEAAWEAGFERAISETASLALEAVGRGAAVDVIVRGARSPLVVPGTSPDAVFCFLAELASCDPSAPLPEVGPRSVSIPVVPLDGAEGDAE